MLTRPLWRLSAALARALPVAGPARARLVDAFDGPAIPIDPEGLEGWASSRT